MTPYAFPGTWPSPAHLAQATRAANDGTSDLPLSSGSMAEMARMALRWVTRAVAALVAVYILFGGVVLAAMLQPPVRFGQFMRHVPMPLVWGALPAERMWLWARGGSLRVGDPAPDFTLPTYDHQSQVTLSSFRGQKPVVLVFGSYT